MRWSNAFIPTLRDAPADAEAVSHKLLVRAGFVRQLAAGLYSLLPLGQRTCGKIAAIVREEMDKIGGQEFLLPALLPSDVWKQSGRWQTIGEEMFRLRDRGGADLCLAMTHEEVFTWLARELRSYKELPQIWYQIQLKFRDEPRPKSGLLRVREFAMKDSYSFDVERPGLDFAFQQHFDAYRRVFERCGLEPLAVEASSGMMGGGESVEFMVASDAGEDWVASCAACGYAANVEKATSELAPIEDPPGPAAPERFATPGVRTIEQLAAFDANAQAQRQVKTLVYVLDGAPALVLLRGDHPLNEQKLADATGARQLRPATAEEVRAALGASPGSLGAVGVQGLPIFADLALRGRRSLTTGANQDDFHLRGVELERDVSVRAWHDLRQVAAGEPCPACGAALVVQKTIEVGHIFKLSTRYSEALGATVLDADGRAVPLVMGSYGIGIGRTMAAAVEACHDEHGIVWPVSIAPFEVAISVLNPNEPRTSEVGARLYEALRAAGVDVLLDDRDERPGVKFKDTELIGVPYRLTVGPKGLEQGKVELVRRRGGARREIDVAKAAEVAIESVLEERR
jgi:prolyl-tRNA synthetase